mmetsp:Transcript_22383/g.55355  ORF Transcript_22383/g.55355 Transcript_22383/m.55355 type:complete len:183 (-) Transcript_22383:213-761(-)
MKQRIAFFLSTRDLMNLAGVSQTMIHELDIAVASSPLTDRVSQNNYYRTCHAVRCFAVAIPKQEASGHSMIFTCNVESHGHVTGNIWVIEQDLPENQHPDYLKRLGFRSDNIVATAVTHDKKEIFMTFPTQHHNCFQCFITTQNRFMRFSNMTLHRVGFGKTSTEYTGYQFDVRDPAGVDHG